MKSLLRAIVCSVLVVGLTLFGLGGMKPAQASVELTCQDVIENGSPVMIQPNVKVTLCPKVLYVYMGTYKPTFITFSNLDEISNATIVMNSKNVVPDATPRRPLLIKPGNLLEKPVTKGGVETSLLQRSVYAGPPIKLH